MQRAVAEPRSTWGAGGRSRGRGRSSRAGEEAGTAGSPGGGTVSGRVVWRYDADDILATVWG